jgi:hypothetical protein
MPDPLEELQKKLYTPERPTLPQAEKSVEPVPKNEPPVLIPLSLEEDLPASGWKRIKWGLAIFLVLALSVAMVVFYRGFYAFRKNNVELKITGPDSVAAGERAVWKISIVNRNEAPLKEGQLSFRFPDYALNPAESSGGSFVPVSGLINKITIAELPPGGLFEKDFAADVIGGENSERQVQALLEFQPASGSTIVFKATAEKKIAISSLPITLDIKSDKETVSGETVVLTIDLQNQSQNAFGNIRARLEYPSGFKTKNSSEKLSDFNNIWKIDQLLPQETKTLTLTGGVNGIAGEGKVFRVFIEGQEGSGWKIYKEASSQLNVIEAPLTVAITTDPEGISSAAASQTLIFKASWQNNLDVALDNVVIKAKITGEAVDFGNIFSGGSFDPISKTITWNSVNLPALATLGPSEKGEAAFQLRVKDKITSGGSIKIDLTGESTTKPEGVAVSKILSQATIVINVNDR